MACQADRHATCKHGRRNGHPFENDLLDLKEYAGINIVDVATFLAILREGTDQE